MTKMPFCERVDVAWLRATVTIRLLTKRHFRILTTEI